MDALFDRGQSLSAYPVKMVYLEVSTSLAFPAQAMFVAPKRSFKLSPDRNLLKRRMRETYRLNKHLLYEKLGEKKMVLAFIYTGRKEESFAVIDRAINKLLAKIG